jgi:hypothetical protein
VALLFVDLPFMIWSAAVPTTVGDTNRSHSSIHPSNKKVLDRQKSQALVSTLRVSRAVHSA